MTNFGLHKVPANWPYVHLGPSYAEHEACSWEWQRGRAIILLKFDLVLNCHFKAVLCDLISCLENSCRLESSESKRQEELCAESVQLQAYMRISIGHHVLVMLGPSRFNVLAEGLRGPLHCRSQSEDLLFRNGSAEPRYTGRGLLWRAMGGKNRPSSCADTTHTYETVDSQGQ